MLVGRPVYSAAWTTRRPQLGTVQTQLSLGVHVRQLDRCSTSPTMARSWATGAGTPAMRLQPSTLDSTICETYGRLRTSSETPRLHQQDGAPPTAGRSLPDAARRADVPAGFPGDHGHGSSQALGTSHRESNGAGYGPAANIMSADIGFYTSPGWSPVP